jgi:hypothetical protein
MLLKSSIDRRGSPRFPICSEEHRRETQQARPTNSTFHPFFKLQVIHFQKWKESGGVRNFANLGTVMLQIGAIAMGGAGKKKLLN